MSKKTSAPPIEAYSVIELTEIHDWAQEIYKLKDTKRRNNISTIKKSGYDIKEQAYNLQEFYLTRLREETDKG
jgi:hypothetical protein